MLEKMEKNAEKNAEKIFLKQNDQNGENDGQDTKGNAWEFFLRERISVHVPYSVLNDRT